MRLSEAVAEFHRGYFSTHRRSPRTQKAYAIDLEQFLAWLGDDRSLPGLTPDDLERWAAELKRRDYASSSIRRKFATLRVFLSYWVRKGVLERSPLWMIRLDLAPQRTLTRVLTVEEMRRLLAAAHRQVAGFEEAGGNGSRPARRTRLDPSDKAFLAVRNVALIEVLFATGIRVGELVALRLCDYRDSESSLLIHGKGSRQRLAFLPDPRSRRAFRRYRSLRTRLSCDHQKLFVNTRGGELSAQGVAAVLTRLTHEAGLTRRITPHMLRHTVATFLLRNGANLRVVQEFLGHSSITTTERYTQVCREDLESALRTHHPNRVRTNSAAGVALDN